MKPSTKVTYSRLLWLLFFLFCFRVLAQLTVYFIDVPFLPAFYKWHSASIPYPALLIFQLIIIIVFGRMAMRFSQGLVAPSPKVGISLLSTGGVYFLFMLVRLIIGAVEISDHYWWNQPIPSIFHLVLASFLIVSGLIHWQHGRK